MTHVVVRLYAGSGSRTTEELVQIALQQLAPQLAKLDGFLRYVVFTLNDGRFGSTSLYTDRNAAEQGLQTAANWVQSTGAMAGYQLERTLRGELIFSFDGQGGNIQRGSIGNIRVFNTPASADQLKAAAEQEGLPILQQMTGIQRWSMIALDEGGCVVIATYRDEQALEDGTEKAHAARQKSGSLAQKALPSDPESMQGVVAGVHGG